ncbi:MAG TPA: HAD-IA family hydrolase [Pyrinomonadaceae bacterium]|nr:HAD-IA family hydrolase [Pyrinomonadaceae bacterium]
MKTMYVRAAIFDFDYTLADSSEGAVECINFALKEMALAEASHESACRTIGLSLKDTFITLAGEAEAQRCDEFSRLFVRRADEVMVGLTTLYESVPATIEELRRQGLMLGIVSTKYRYRIEEILARSSLLHFFEVIVGGEDVKQHKPDPEGLFEAIERLGCSPASVVYAGDSVADAEVSRRASVPFIAVLSGVTERECFDSYEAIAVLDNLSQLPALLSSLSPEHDGPL